MTVLKLLRNALLFVAGILTAMALTLVVMMALFPGDAQASDRCQSMEQEVRTAHFRYFGLDFPWWYGVAQLQKESGCRNVLSRDGVGSEGPAQITFRWWKKPLAAEGIAEVRSTKNNLRAQAFIMKDAWDASPQRLWVAYQIYNGGRLVLKEIARGGLGWHAARKECRRKDIVFDNGQVINACDINYQYPVKIERYADAYRRGTDARQYPFW
jgi:hypothetical protein